MWSICRMRVSVFSFESNLQRNLSSLFLHEHLCWDHSTLQCSKVHQTVRYQSVLAAAVNKTSKCTSAEAPLKYATCLWCRYSFSASRYSTSPIPGDVQIEKTVIIQGKTYKCDEWTNVTPRVISAVGQNLHLQKDHPLCLIKDVIVQHFYKNYPKSPRSPLFAVFDDLPPVVTTQQNFDSMLIPKDHVSRKKSDNYYVNKTRLLRAHTSAHEHELLKSGLNAFLVVGDVYRRDTIDSTHYPVFHQLEGVRLFNKQELFSDSEVHMDELALFEDSPNSEDKQGCHTMEAAKLLELNLKQTIENCVFELFGPKVEFKWVDAYFPFTHPSFELEIKCDGEWVEMLGCGILRQEILKSAGVTDKAGWAFGLGLERLAMKMFNIPDIRLFWSADEAFLSQFRGVQNIMNVKFTPMVSKQPALRNDISFWISDDKFCSNDFYDLVRSLDSNLIETVSLVDDFVHPKTGKCSHCYSIFYRHLSRPLTQTEVASLHEAIQRAVVEQFNVEGRW